MSIKPYTKIVQVGSLVIQTEINEEGVSFFKIENDQAIISYAFNLIDPQERETFFTKLDALIVTTSLFKNALMDMEPEMRKFKIQKEIHEQSVCRL